MLVYSIMGFVGPNGSSAIFSLHIWYCPSSMLNCSGSVDIGGRRAQPHSTGASMVKGISFNLWKISIWSSIVMAVVVVVKCCTQQYLFNISLTRIFRDCGIYVPYPHAVLYLEI